jgi:hypothetical protein
LVHLDQKNFQLAALEANEDVIYGATPDMLADRDFALKAIQLNSGLYTLVARSLKKSREFRLECCRVQADVIFDMLPLDREFAIDALEVNPAIIKRLPDEFLNDSEFLLWAFNRNIRSWFEIHPEDPVVVTDFDFNPAWITAVMKFTNAKCFPDLEDAERDNHLFAEPAPDVNPLMLEYAGPSIRNDFRLCLKDAKKVGRRSLLCLRN